MQYLLRRVALFNLWEICGKIDNISNEIKSSNPLYEPVVVTLDITTCMRAIRALVPSANHWCQCLLCRAQSNYSVTCSFGTAALS